MSVICCLRCCCCAVVPVIESDLTGAEAIVEAKATESRGSVVNVVVVVVIVANFRGRRRC